MAHNLPNSGIAFHSATGDQSSQGSLIQGMSWFRCGWTPSHVLTRTESRCAFPKTIWQTLDESLRNILLPFSGCLCVLPLEALRAKFQARQGHNRASLIKSIILAGRLQCLCSSDWPIAHGKANHH